MEPEFHQFRNVAVVKFEARANCSWVRPSRRLACVITKPLRAEKTPGLCGRLQQFFESSYGLPSHFSV